MDLEDLYSDMDDEELGALFSAGGKLSLPSTGSVSLTGGITGTGSRRSPAQQAAMRASSGGLFGTPLRLVTNAINRSTSQAKKAATSAARKRAIIAAMAKSAKRKAKPKRKPVSLANRVMTLKRKPTTYMSQFPISHTCPAAYRQLACNAGVGGTAGVALLQQIKDMVELNNTRQLATSEHNHINNTLAFRREVLKRLANRARCK